MVDVKTLCPVCIPAVWTRSQAPSLVCGFQQTKFIYVDASSGQADGQMYEVPSPEFTRDIMVLFWDKHLVRNVDLPPSVAASKMCGITFRLNTARCTDSMDFCMRNTSFDRQCSNCLLVGRECCVITIAWCSN